MSDSKYVVAIDSKESWENEVLKSKIPVVVDFWAEWCGPCKMLSPVLDAVAEDMDGKIKVAKVDCEKNMELASEMGVRNIPAIFLYVDGVKVKRATGSMNKTGVMKFLEGI